MGMEGINWEEVNSQVKAIFDALNNLKKDLVKDYQNFVDEMSYYWASGNAKKFGDFIQKDVSIICNSIDTKEKDIAKLIQHAAQIYANTFNVDNQIYVGLNSDETVVESITNPFQEKIGNVTGMNRKAAEDCYLKLSGLIYDLESELDGTLNSIELSIFDVANAQKEAFNQKIRLLFAEIDASLDEEYEIVLKYKEQEWDRIELAKQQTVNTFNA